MRLVIAAAILCCLASPGRAVDRAATPLASAGSFPAVSPGALPDIGEEISLEALTCPDRFGWPARFTCRLHTDHSEALVVVGASFAELDEKLAALDVVIGDCRGGFALDSVEPQDGKLDRIVAAPADRDT